MVNNKKQYKTLLDTSTGNGAGDANATIATSLVMGHIIYPVDRLKIWQDSVAS